MEILPKGPTVKAGSDRFIGDAWIDTIVRGEEPSRVRVSVVRFAPGARNAWHAHSVGQTVHVTEGIGRSQRRGGPVEEIRPGDRVFFEPAEEHWHGAAPDRFMTHLALLDVDDEGNNATWGEHVSDAEYTVAPSSP